METIMIRGKELSKSEFFDEVFRTFVGLNDPYDEAYENQLLRQLSAYRNLLRSYGWMDDYMKFVVNKAHEVEL